MKVKSIADSKETVPKLKKQGVTKEKAVKTIKKKQKKEAKDPNMPKKPPSAFFVFMEEFRPQFKRDNPENKAISAVAKAAGAKWKSMPDTERAPYVKEAEKRKSEYTQNMQTYNNKNLEGQEEGSDKSKSEVSDDKEAESGEEEQDKEA